MGNGLSLSGYTSDQRAGIESLSHDMFGTTYESLTDDMKFEILMQAAQLGFLGSATSIGDIWKQKLGQ